jgi:sugar lactone lactonase YvrE
VDPNAARRTAAVIAALVLLAGCARADRAGHDVLVVRTARGLATLDALTGSLAYSSRDAILAPGTPMLIGTHRRGGTTVVRSTDARTGARAVLARLDGRFAVATASSTAIALTEPGPAGSRTRIAVVRLDGSRPRVFSKPGALVPEAFTARDRTLVVVAYLEGARRYRLMELDLRSGELDRLGARIKQLAPEEMVGTARVQALSPDGATLFTLYTRQPQTFPHGRPQGPAPTGPAAFVHVLDLRVGSAHCVALPPQFGAGRARSDALAVSPDGRRVFVVDGAAGSVAAVDRTAMATIAVGVLDVAPGSSIVAGAASDGSLLVARGDEIVSLDPGSLAVVRRWSAGARVTGLGFGEAGPVYVASEGAVATFTTSGAPLDRPTEVAAALRSILGVFGA